MVTRRKDEPPSNGAGKGKIKFRYTDSERTLDFNMENVASEAVTEGLRSLATALAGRPLIPEPGRAKPKALAASAVEEEEEIEAPAADGAGEVVADSEEFEEEEDEPGKPKRPRKIRAPAFIADLKLTDAAVSLADFMKQKNPTAMLDKYAVVAVWFKEQFGLTEISIDHIFTAFKHLGLDSKLPTDVEKPLKNLTYNRHWFEKGKADNTFAIIWLGESEVGKMAAGVATS